VSGHKVLIWKVGELIDTSIPANLSIDKLLMDLLNLILMLLQSFSPSLLFFLIINVRWSKEIKEFLLSHVDEIPINGSFLKIKGKD